MPESEYPFRRFTIQSDEIEFEWVSFRHAGLLVGVSESHIRNLVKDGTLDMRRLAFANVPLVSRTSLEQYARTKTKAGAGT